MLRRFNHLSRRLFNPRIRNNAYKLVKHPKFLTTKTSNSTLNSDIELGIKNRNIELFKKGLNKTNKENRIYIKQRLNSDILTSKWMGNSFALPGGFMLITGAGFIFPLCFIGFGVYGYYDADKISELKKLLD